MKQCILILGMHRSGTSALSGILHILGVYQGLDLLPPSNENRKGFFENKHILDFNEKVLDDHGASWDDLFFDGKKLIIDKYAEELKTLISEKFGHARCFSIKDPRICLLFPIYEKALTELGITIHPLIIYRNPLETAVSLQERDRFSLEKGLILWLEHFLLSEKYTRSYSRIFVQFDQLLRDHRTLITTIQETWGLNLEIDPDKQERLSSFLQSDLKHINISLHDLSQKLPDSMQALVRILPDPQKISGNQEALDKIRRVFFREKAFFFLKELRDSLKQIDTYRYAQFFIDTGQGFCEDKSRHVLNPEDKKTIELDLSEFSDIQGIRFDPLNQAVAISIISVAFQLKNNEWLQAEIRPLNACYALNEIDYFSHNDPNYFIPVPRTLTAQLRRLVIRVHYHKIDGREVAPIVCTMLRQLLQKQRKVLIYHILRREQWWKNQSQSMRQAAIQKMKSLEQSLDVERRAKLETDQALRRLEQSIVSSDNYF